MKKLLKKSSVSVIILCSISLFFFLVALNAKVSGNPDNFELPEVTEIIGGNTSAENDGKTVFAVGTPKALGTVTDPLTGISTNAMALKREVEVYQYTTDGYSVYKEFRSSQVMNIGGEKEYTNPEFTKEYQNAYFFNDAVLDGGNLKIGESGLLTVAKFGESESEIINAAKEQADSIGARLYEGRLYFADDPANPAIGDVRITYKAVNPESGAKYTFIGEQENMTFCKAEKPEDAYVLQGENTVNDFYDMLMGHPDSVFNAGIFLGIVLAAATAIVILVKKKKLNKSALRAFAVIFALAVSVNSLGIISKADFGDYGGDYDYGGGYDYGGYDSGGYDYGGYDSGNDDDYVTTEEPKRYSYEDYPTDEPYLGKSLYYSPAGAAVDAVLLLTDADIENEDGSIAMGILALIVIFDVILLIVRKVLIKKDRPSAAARPVQVTKTQKQNLVPVSEYQSVDDTFSVYEFTERIAKMYVELQNGWQNKDLTPLRGYMTDTFYAQIDRQLSHLRSDGQTNIVTDIKVNSVVPSGWYVNGENDVIEVLISASIRDYIIDDKTDEVVKGNPKDVKMMEYRWTLVRPRGVKTADSGLHTEVCPNCGAPLEINTAGRCEYCGSIIESKGTDWAITSIEGISQRTIHN